MAKEYYDQPINASTKWGGDSSTGGKKVRGLRVQEWIKNQLLALAGKMEIVEAGSLPAASASTRGKLYLIPASSPSGNNNKKKFVTCSAIVVDCTDVYLINNLSEDTSAVDVFLCTGNASYTMTQGVGLYEIDHDSDVGAGLTGLDSVQAYVKSDAPGYVFSRLEGKLFKMENGKLIDTGQATNCYWEQIGHPEDYIPALAGNIESWEERRASVESVFTEAVRTTAGDESIDSGKPARLVSIVAKSDFAATALEATGFNLLHGAKAVGGGYYFAVPKLSFGTYGTADKNNGVLFTKNDGTNLKPTVRFKPIGSGVPANVNDGSICDYTDSNGKRFYTTSGAGYLIVSGITLANTCAHIAWSRRYDEFVRPDDYLDSSSFVPLTAIINACHDFGLLLVASNPTGSVADSIAFGDDKATWTRRVSRVKPTWDNVNNGDGTYTHTTTISGMKDGGIVECGQLQLDVTLNVVSYTDENSAATTDYVKYEIATEATGNVTIKTTYNVEDWGLELLSDVSGEAEVTVEYAQGFPDAVAALLGIRSVLEAQVGGNEGRISHVEKEVAEPTESLPMVCGQPMKLYAAGTPAEALVPDNWIPLADGGYAWTGLPTVIGQEYIDTENGGKYEAVWDNFTQRTLKWLKV